MVELAQRLVLLLCFGHTGFNRTCSDRLDHNVSGCVFEACKLNHGHIVSAGFKLQTTETVGKIFGESVLQYSIFEDRLMKIVFLSG